MKPVVQIVGLQRSGTNWLACLLANNYDALVLSETKHDFPSTFRFREDLTGVVVIYKRLDHWLNSIARFPATLPQQYPAIYHNGALDMVAAARLYDDFYTQWGQYPRVCLVAYEDLLDRADTMTAAIAQRFGLAPIGRKEFYDKGPQWDRMNQGKIDFYLSRGDFACHTKPF